MLQPYVTMAPGTMVLLVSLKGVTVYNTECGLNRWNQGEEFKSFLQQKQEAVHYRKLGENGGARFQRVSRGRELGGDFASKSGDLVLHMPLFEVKLQLWSKCGRKKLRPVFSHSVSERSTTNSASQQYVPIFPVCLPRHYGNTFL